MRLPPAPVVRYGDHPDQVANLHLPEEGEAPWPCVVLLHGGFWRDRWDRTLMTPLARELSLAPAVAVWNVEYRRVGQEGGGWPGTLLDVATAVDHLERIPEVDVKRVVTVGHSAGGHLALWLAARHRLTGDAPGAAPRVRPVGAVALAGVCDLARGADEQLGSGAVAAFLGGGPADVSERYAVASPAALLPLGVPQLLVHGAADDIVPPDHSRRYALDAAAAGDRAEVVVVDGEDHFDVVEADSAGWYAVYRWLAGLFGVGQ